MISQHDYRLNWLTNTVSASDGSALCVIALAHEIGNIWATPGLIRRTLRRWKRKGIVDDRLKVLDFQGAHRDLGLHDLDLNFAYPRWRLRSGEVGYAYLANVTGTDVHCSLIDAEGGVIYDPLGSDLMARGSHLIRLRIFKLPA